MFGCVACQFQIRNRGALPTCPSAARSSGPTSRRGRAPCPRARSPAPRPRPRRRRPGREVQEGVKLDAPVSVQENVKLEP